MNSEFTTLRATSTDESGVLVVVSNPRHTVRMTVWMATAATSSRLLSGMARHGDVVFSVTEVQLTESLREVRVLARRQPLVTQAINSVNAFLESLG